MSSTYDMVIVPMNSLQLWLLAQDLHKFEACQHSIMNEGGFHEALPFPEKILTVRGCWEIGARGDIIYFNGLATGKVPIFQ